MRAASWTAADSSMIRGMRIANSSPPSRARESLDRSTPRRRVATAAITWSPAWCPSVSLISRKPSTSMSMTAVSMPSRRAAAIARSVRSRNSSLLGRPVSSSCIAWWAVRSAPRRMAAACRPSASPRAPSASIMRPSTACAARVGRRRGGRGASTTTYQSFALPVTRAIRWKTPRRPSASTTPRDPRPSPDNETSGETGPPSAAPTRWRWLESKTTCPVRASTTETWRPPASSRDGLAQRLDRDLEMEDGAAHAADGDGGGSGDDPCVRVRRDVRRHLIGLAGRQAERRADEGVRALVGGKRRERGGDAVLESCHLAPVRRDEAGLADRLAVGGPERPKRCVHLAHGRACARRWSSPEVPAL